MGGNVQIFQSDMGVEMPELKIRHIVAERKTGADPPRFHTRAIEYGWEAAIDSVVVS